MAVQVKSRVLRAVDGIIAGHVGQQIKGRAAISVCVKGCLQISKFPLQAVALAIVQGCFSHRGRVAVGTGSGAFVKAVLAAVAARLYHQVAGLGSGFLQRELRVVTVVSKSRFLGKQITQCDVIIQQQTASRNLSAVQLDCAAPNLQLEQSGMAILRIKYQRTAVPHGHSHRAVAAAAVNNRQFTGANLARGRKAADIQAVSAQTVSVQIQREGLADIYTVRQHRVCQQLDGRAVYGVLKRGSEVKGVGGLGALNFHLGNHFCAAIRAGEGSLVHSIVRAMVAADGADTVYQHRLFFAQVSVCVASAAFAVGNAMRFVLGVVACMRLDRVCSSSEFRTTGVRKTAIRPIEGIILG